jgi:hypothetical protein
VMVGKGGSFRSTPPWQLSRSAFHRLPLVSGFLPFSKVE